MCPATYICRSRRYPKSLPKWSWDLLERVWGPARPQEEKRLPENRKKDFIDPLCRDPVSHPNPNVSQKRCNLKRCVA